MGGLHYTSAILRIWIRALELQILAFVKLIWITIHWSPRIPFAPSKMVLWISSLCHLSINISQYEVSSIFHAVLVIFIFPVGWCIVNQRALPLPYFSALLEAIETFDPQHVARNGIKLSFGFEAVKVTCISKVTYAQVSLNILPLLFWWPKWVIQISDIWNYDVD